MTAAYLNPFGTTMFASTRAGVRNTKMRVARAEVLDVFYSLGWVMRSKIPSAGNLDDKPLYQLLITGLERRMNGSLVLESPDGGKSAVILAAGKVVKIKTAVPVARLGTVCVGSGMVTTGQLEEVLAAPRSGLLGEALIKAHLLKPDQLESVLADQMLQQVEWMARLPQGSVYGFYPDKDYLQNWGGAPRSVEPLQVIWAAMRSISLPKRLVDNTLAALASRDIKLHPNSRVGRFGFTDRERALVNVLRAKPQPMAQLVNCGILPPAETRRLLVCLALTKHLHLGADVSPLGVAPKRTQAPTERPKDLIERASSIAAMYRSSPGEAPDDALSARREQLQAQADELLKGDYYALLGVPQDAPGAAIQSAFLAKAKEWHPDKVAPQLSDMKDVLTKVFSRMTEAHQTLTHADRRAEYDRVIGEGSAEDGEHEEVQRVLRAAASFQKAEVLVKRREWQQATDAAKKAHEGDPEQAEYEALFVWLLARQIQGGDKSSYRRFIERLSKAVKKQPNNARVRLYRARVLKSAGMVNEAMRDYKTVVEADPSHVEAQREIRLHRMRTGPSVSEDTSLLGRLFKKG